MVLGMGEEMREHMIYKQPYWIFRRFGDSVFLSKRLRLFIRSIEQNWIDRWVARSLGAAFYSSREVINELNKGFKKGAL